MPSFILKNISIKTGRVNRRQYLLYWLISAGAVGAAETFDSLLGVQFISLLVSAFFNGYLFLVFIVKRVRDMGYSGWYGAAALFLTLLAVAISIFFEPALFVAGIIALFLTVGLLVWPGQKGPNKYGPQPEGWMF